MVEGMSLRSFESFLCRPRRDNEATLHRDLTEHMPRISQDDGCRLNCSLRFCSPQPLLSAYRVTEATPSSTSHGSCGDKLAVRTLDGCPMWFQAPKSSVLPVSGTGRAIFCLHHKVSSSGWSALLLRAASNNTWGPGASARGLGFVHYLPMYPRARPHEMAAAAAAGLLSRRVPRIRIVRNPYVRLLSAFLDKLAGDRTGEAAAWTARHRPVGFTPGGSFGSFVVAMLRLEGRSVRAGCARQGCVDPHFGLQSAVCLLPGGATYDFALRLEEMELWYEPLVRLLGLKRAVQSPFWTPHVKQPCFWAPPGRRCTHMFRSDATATARHADATVRTNVHNSGAQRHVQRYYADAGVLANATRLVMPDLRAFGYPPWTNFAFGHPVSAREHSLATAAAERQLRARQVACGTGRALGAAARQQRRPASPASPNAEKPGVVGRTLYRAMNHYLGDFSL